MRAERLPRRAVWTGLGGTAAIHVAALIALLASVSGARPSMPPTYAVELVAAPIPTGARRPVPEATVAPPAAPPKPVAKPKPAPIQTTARPAGRRETAAHPAVPVTPLPGEKPGTGSDIANVKLAGKEFPYPEYLRNLVTQIYRRWNRPIGNASLTAEVSFMILRDGTVKDINVVSTSRSYSFDLEAKGAIESAALSKAFGPLPTGYPADYLQINFMFTPRQVP